MSRLRVLLVDDEPLARERVRSLLVLDPDVEIVGECASGLEAVRTIAEDAPDIVFLDVQMPGADGFEVLRQLPREAAPVVVFVTAHDQFALRAFDVQAIDYLLKPFAPERFAMSLERAKQAARGRVSGVFDDRVTRLLAMLEQEQGYLKRIAVTSPGKVVFVRTEEIDTIEADGNYVRIRVGKEEHLHRETMKELEAKLDPRRFCRIHRAWIVNLERVRGLEGTDSSGATVRLRDGRELPASRGQADRLRELLERAG